jgi:hypothetical protein
MRASSTDLTEIEEADRLDVDRSEDEGDTASEVDRWEDLPRLR